MADPVVRPLAEADVREAALWYESKREGLGAEFVLELDALYERIAENPRQFPEIGEGARRGRPTARWAPHPPPKPLRGRRRVGTADGTVQSAGCSSNRSTPPSSEGATTYSIHRGPRL